MADFDKIIERQGTKSAKYDMREEMNIPPDAISMWVADMDFQTPEPVREALIKTAEHGIFGYSGPDKAYKDAVLGWMERRFGYTPDEEEMVQTPGVVFGIAHAIRAFTNEGDSVLIQEPVYYPFRMMAERNGRNVVSNNLVEAEDGTYQIDFEDFEKQINDNDVKLFILCNPHNPVGRVFTEDELRKMAEICLKHGVLIVSDEIHSDFIHGDRKHIMLPTLGEEIAENTILATAPSKTFNLAGLQGSNFFIKDKEKRELFNKELQKSGAGSLTIMAYNAGQAAYENGDEWVDELNGYIEGNFEYIQSFIDENIPELRANYPEGTYLVWIDCRGLGMDDEKLKDFFVNEAKLWLDEGTLFGEGGSGFMRVNAAAPRALVEKAMAQLKEAVDGLRKEEP